MVIGFFLNNRFEENSLSMASTPTGYCRTSIPRQIIPMFKYDYPYSKVT